MVGETNVRWMSGDEFQRSVSRNAHSRLRDGSLTAGGAPPAPNSAR
jgi:hypothetical protein